MVATNQTCCSWELLHSRNQDSLRLLSDQTYLRRTIGRSLSICLDNWRPTRPRSRDSRRWCRKDEPWPVLQPSARWRVFDWQEQCFNMEDRHLRNSRIHIEVIQHSKNIIISAAFSNAYSSALPPPEWGKCVKVSMECFKNHCILAVAKQCPIKVTSKPT